MEAAQQMEADRRLPRRSRGTSAAGASLADDACLRPAWLRRSLADDACLRPAWQRRSLADNSSAPSMAARGRAGGGRPLCTAGAAAREPGDPPVCSWRGCSGGGRPLSVADQGADGPCPRLLRGSPPAVDACSPDDGALGAPPPPAAPPPPRCAPAATSSFSARAAMCFP
eukprot:356586-Chlamydomonas_euryale.AAC.6